VSNVYVTPVLIAILIVVSIALGFTYFQLQTVLSEAESFKDQVMKTNTKLKEQNEQLKAQLQGLVARTQSDSSQKQSSGSSQGSKIPFVTIAKGSVSGVTESKNLVIKSSEELEEIWNEIYSVRPAIPPLPEIDFTRADVLAAFNGERPNSCYDILIKDIQVISGHGDDHLGHGSFDERVAIVMKTEPGEDAVCTQSTTQAYHLVAIPSWPFEITFDVWTEKIK